MTYKQLIKYFGSASETARALGISRSAVYLWGKRNNYQIPIRRQYEIQEITKGELKVNGTNEPV